MYTNMRIIISILCKKLVIRISHIHLCGTLCYYMGKIFEMRECLGVGEMSGGYSSRGDLSWENYQWGRVNYLRGWSIIERKFRWENCRDTD